MDGVRIFADSGPTQLGGSDRKRKAWSLVEGFVVPQDFCLFYASRMIRLYSNVFEPRFFFRV